MNTQMGEYFGDSDNAKLRAVDEAIGKLGMPQKTVLKNPEGHMISLCQNYDEKKESMENGIHIKTKGGKYIKLEDAPKMNNIIMKVDDPEDEKNDIAFINIQQKSPEEPFEEVSAIGFSPPPYSIDIGATNAVNMTSFKSDIKLAVIDGGQIDIINNSTGNQKTDETDSTPGNINIESPEGDINLSVGGLPQSGVDSFFGTPYQSSRVAAINIKATGGDLTAINIESAGSLSLKGKKSVYIGSDTSVTIEAPSIILITKGQTTGTPTGPATGVDDFFGNSSANAGGGAGNGGQIKLLGGEITITGTGPVTNLQWP
jgi:hypothetical protein